MTSQSKPFIVRDRWLIAIALILVSITLWNSRYAVIPTPRGYARYVDYGVVFLYPDDMNLWEVAIFDDGRVVHDGSIPISEDRGTVGWNSGNVDFERPGRDDYWQESSLTWLKTGPPVDNELYLFYSALTTNAERYGREFNISKGETGVLTHGGHDGSLQYFNYTTRDIGSTDKSIIYGIVGGYFCDKTGRSVELYYLDIYDSDPVYDKEALYSTFMFLFDSIDCH